VRGRGARGFLLLEALLGVAILALCLGFAYRGLASSLEWSARGEAETAAWSLAQSALARLGRDVPLAPGVAEGREGGLAWSARMAPVAAAMDGRVLAYAVEIRVAWRARGRERDVVLRSALLAPAAGAAP
jgi:type II secretory pathway pseudopilin PulG